jgi:hypothetical protein
MITNVDRSQINGNASQIAKDLDRVFLRANELKTFLDGIADGNLITDYGYLQADINDLRSALLDVEALRLIYIGNQPQTSVKDFRLFLKRIWGLGALF